MLTNDSLPRGWRWAKLGDITRIATGGTPSTVHYEYYGGDIHWLTSGDVKGTYVHDVPHRITQQGLDNSNAKVHPAGSVMLAMSGQGKTRGTSAILKVPSACSQSVAAILPTTEALPEIIHFALVKSYENTRRITGDNERTGLNLKIIQKIEIPLPPLEEQKPIARILIAQMAAIEKARTAAKARLEAAKALPAAYLREIFESEEGKGWPKNLLGTLCSVKGGKRLPKGTDFTVTKTNHPYLRVVDFENGNINLNELKYLDNQTQSQISRYIINSDDVYISIAGTIGLIGVIPEELDGSNLTENAARLIIKDKNNLSRDYLAGYLKSPLGQEAIKQRTNAVGQPKLALERIATIGIPLPNISKQNDLLTNINNIFHETSYLVTTLQRELDAISALPAALLGQAFSGGL